MFLDDPDPSDYYFNNVYVVNSYWIQKRHVFCINHEDVCIWCEKLPKLKRDVIGFEIELEIK